MTEDEVPKTVRDEYEQLMSRFGLTQNDIIIKKDQLMSEQEVAQHGFTSLEIVKEIGKVIIMVAKKGFRVMAIVVFLFGLYDVAKVISMFAFEKRLPDAVDLAQRARQGAIEISYDIRDQRSDTPEKWVVIPPSPERLNDEQYLKNAYGFLTGERPTKKLFDIGAQFIPISGMPIEALTSTSSNSIDFIG